MKAIQDYYAEKYSHCYGCGRNNPQGHHLKSYPDGEQTIARFTVPEQYTGGVPEHVYGGMVASLLDCHGTASAAYFAAQNEGLSLDEELGRCRFVTASLKVDFLQPTPIATELVIRACLRAVEGRKVQLEMTMSAAGSITAKAEMLAVRLQN